MIEFGLTIVLSGSLSYASPSLFDQVALNRQQNLAFPAITKNYEQYDCLLGVPVNYEYLIDREAYLIVDSTFYGPHFIVDVQAKSARDMQLDGLVADITCSEFVHKQVSLAIKGEDTWKLN